MISKKWLNVLLETVGSQRDSSIIYLILYHFCAIKYLKFFDEGKSFMRVNDEVKEKWKLG